MNEKARMNVKSVVAAAQIDCGKYHLLYIIQLPRNSRYKDSTYPPCSFQQAQLSYIIVKPALAPFSHQRFQHKHQPQLQHIWPPCNASAFSNSSPHLQKVLRKSWPCSVPNITYHCLPSQRQALEPLQRTFILIVSLWSEHLDLHDHYVHTTQRNLVLVIPSELNNFMRYYYY